MDIYRYSEMSIFENADGLSTKIVKHRIQYSYVIFIEFIYYF